MHESPEHWRYHKQVKEGMYHLHERLIVLVQEADQGMMGVKHFTLADDYIMLNYARREGKFAWEPYEQSRVFGEHAQHYAYESGAEVTLTRDEQTGYRIEITSTGEPRDNVDKTVDWTGRSVEYEALGNGKAEKIKSQMDQWRRLIITDMEKIKSKAGLAG